jgi:hypothetical protein
MRTLLDRYAPVYSPDEPAAEAPAETSVPEGTPLPSADDEPKAAASTEDAVEKAMRDVGLNDETDDDEPEPAKPIKDGGPDEKKAKAEPKEKKDEPSEKPESKAKEEAKAEDASDDDEPTDNDDDEGDDDTRDDSDEGEGDDEPLSKAPDRFSSDAKAEWEETPMSVRGETARAIEELNAGIEKYREDAENYSEFKEFHEILQKNGQKFEEVIGQYVGIENLLKKNPYEGMDRIAQNFGSSLREMAANLMQQPLEAREEHYINQIRQLNQTVKQMYDTIQHRQQLDQASALDNARQELKDFTDSHPHMNDSKFAEEVSFFYTSGKADTLETAYDMAAKQLGVTDAPKPKAPVVADDEQTAQTPRVRSQNGSPRRGSNPRKRGAASSVEKSVDDAFSRVGL